ncbi:DUF3331 domain-containing protein [Paraburkholderia sp. EG287A]|uniref:DUF3331 domain-containing protein n=1 Tax=unclassified Paraburkholderia TaxID=2615204 RepID=UPI0034D3505A
MSGYCALTGRSIHRGDLIYRPQLRGRSCAEGFDETTLAFSARRMSCGLDAWRAAGFAFEPLVSDADSTA